MEEPFKLEGLNDVIAALKTLVPTPAEVNKILIKVADPLTEEIRREIPIGPTGNLRRSIRTITYKANRVVVGAKYPEGAHIFLYELGTTERNKKNKQRSSTGIMPAQNVIIRNFQQYGKTALITLGVEFKKLILDKGAKSLS